MLCGQPIGFTDFAVELLRFPGCNTVSKLARRASNVSIPRLIVAKGIKGFSETECPDREEKRSICYRSKTLWLDWCFLVLRSVYPIVLVPRRNAPRSGVTCILWLDHLPRHNHQPRCLVMPSPNAANTSESVYCFALHPPWSSIARGIRILSVLFSF